jgi:proteasome lid subunit RPN8/RPN11
MENEKANYRPDPPKEVLIEPPAFLSMILASAEVFRKECFGLLLGNRGFDRYVIEHAFAVQTAQRSLYWSKPNEKREARITELSKRLSLGVELLGDFHSHCQLGSSKALAKPSTEDVAFMEAERVYIILALNKTKQNIMWGQNIDKTISGTLGDYHFRIGAYIAWGTWKYYKLKVICPIATGIR